MPAHASQQDKNLSPSQTRGGVAWAAAALLLAVGYADLVRGGITVSAILLTSGYCVAIPWALLAGARSGDEAADVRPPYLAALFAAVAVLALYLATLSPSTAMWDASEYLAAAYTFGLPHPPGNPLFVILGRVFSILPIAPNVAMRINVLAALSSAVAAGVWFLTAERVAARWGLPRWQRYATGALAALIGATAFTVWTQSVVNEKVYTVSLVGIAVISWLMLRWSDAPDSPRADRLLVLVAYLLGLGYANHMAGMLPLPAVGLVVLLRRPRVLLRWRLMAAAVLAIVVGLTPFATQPIRAAFSPPINEGEPTACRDGLKVSCTFSKGTYDAFMYNFNRGQYGKPTLSERQAPLSAQVGMWWLYFKWQWVRDVHQTRPGLQGAMAAIFLMLGLLGGWTHYRRDPRGFWYFGPLMFSMTLALIYYLNFRYGASQDPAADVPREVRDRDYFYLWSFSAWGVWAALGFVRVWQSLASLLGRRPDGPAPRWAHGATAPVLALAMVPLVANWSPASRRNDVTTMAFARDLLNSVEPYGVLITAGDNDTFPLWYAQEVEGVRKDVTVAVLSLMNTDWFARGIIRRPVHAYDSARGPAAYRGRSWPRPDGPPLRATLREADSVPPYFVVAQPLRFQAKGLDATIDPQILPKLDDTPILERADLLVLRIIADSWPERPVYFSRTAGSYAERLGLGEHTLSQGLARKLIPAIDVPGSDTVYVSGSGWFDIARSRELWKEFTGPAAILRRNDWVDRPSLSTAYAYLLAGSELSELQRFRGDTAAAAQTFDTVFRVARAVRVEGLLQQAAPQRPIPSGDTTRAPAGGISAPIPSGDTAR